MSFKEVLILRRCEWIPFITGFLFRFVVVASGYTSFWGMNEALYIVLGPCSTILMLFGVGAWLWRLNRWIRESNKSETG